MKKFKKAAKRQASDQTKDAKKSLGLFDHVKQITQVQNPDYFNTLSDEDKKSFNPFMILRAISMNPERLSDVAFLYRYFDIIPHPALFKLLISLLPPDRRYYPWIKAKKNHKYSKEVYDYVSQRLECSPKEAKEHVDILMMTPEGREELFTIIRGYGLTEKEVDKLMESENEY